MAGCKSVVAYVLRFGKTSKHFTTRAQLALTVEQKGSRQRPVVWTEGLTKLLP
ncbi:hypothetical protein RESH_05787 [Rhodopirellula europaea SH398]|uniref:Uncharacterized protein n=1 Tax=Rhodopirellula europaea SH398 TaxID=1263868 RepID=M5RWZ4_9BACT|nr:hypothetical protein RESH_05787 [Rhodopirellula europaea SH398]